MLKRFQEASKPALSRALPIFLSLAVFLFSSIAVADAREQAKRIHDRLTGIPGSSTVIDQMTQLIEQGKVKDAALIAMENPMFYNLMLKNWVTTWTNDSESPRAELNDYTATIIGMIRDNVSFDQTLYGDIIYTASDAAIQGTQIPVYNAANNLHYQGLENGRIDLKAALTQRQQSTLTGITDVAGVLTTRASGEAFFQAGTNRRVIRFALMNFLCNDMEQMSDTTIPDFRVRQDVTRSPGGDLVVFKTKCVGCHAGMDGLAGALAHFDFQNGRLVHTPSDVQDKMLINSNSFPDGYVTTNDQWVNLWNLGQNARIGWNGASNGFGINSLGRMLASTEQFPKCMAQRSYERMCLRKPAKNESESINKLAEDFKTNNYNMKQLLADTARVCLVD